MQEFHALTNAQRLLSLLRAPLAELRTKDPKLADEARRASRSIVANTAEGSGRLGRDRRHFFSIALGSARELDAHLRIAVGEELLAADAMSEPLAVLDREKGLLWGLTH